MTKDAFMRKIVDLRHKYGHEEAEYFKNHPSCETCPENRLAALTIHHVEGRSKKIFQTLCFNCHMIVHSLYPEYTYQNYLDFLDDKNAIRSDRLKRDRLIVESFRKGKSLRQIGRDFDLSHNTVRDAIKRLENV